MSRRLRWTPIAAALLFAGPAAGQERERLFLPHDLDVAENLGRIDKLAERGQWDRVVAALDQILAEGGGVLLEEDGSYWSARSEARRRLLALEGEGRRAYELVHEGPARRLLEEALRGPALEPLLAILDEHPATDEAVRARRLLVGRYFERGQPGAALDQVEALLTGARLDREERARLAGLRVLALASMGRSGEARAALEALPAEADGERIGEAAAALRPAPPAPPPERPAALAWSREVFGYYEVSDAGSRPWTLPRADVGWVYAHDGSHATAIDLSTGKLAWRTPLRPADAFLRPEGLCRLALAQGVVLCVRPGDGGLAGLDRTDGTLLWSRSLREVKAAADIDFDAHFSGRPEVVGDVVVLTLVTEHDDREVHALAFDVFTGELAWKVFVASQNKGTPPLPALAQGMERIYVVTGLGAVACLDTEGELLWVRRYRSIRDRERQPQGPWGGIAEPPPLDLRDPTAVVARGVLWAAPCDAEGFFCWDARTGERRGEVSEPKDGRILAPRETGVVVLSEGFDLYQVTRAGGDLLERLGGFLVGRPTVAGGRAYLPRGDGVLEVDLAAGRAERFAGWEASGGPGSVVVAGRRLVVAAPRGLFAYGREVGPAGPDPADPVAALGDPSFARREAAQAALLARGEAARATLVEAADHADPEVRLRARIVLGELDRRARLERWRPLVKEEWAAQVADLLNRLTHPNPEVRLQALRAMGAVQGDDVVVLLRDLLQDGDPRVTYHAAAALLRRGSREGIDLLTEAVVEGLPADRLLAVRAIRGAGEPEDAGRVAPALDDRDPAVRTEAVVAVLALGGDDAVASVLPLMEDEADEVRLAILQGLAAANVRGREAVAVLAEAVDDDNDMIRGQAVDALLGIHDRAAYAALGRALGDPVVEIAKKAATRLFKVAQKDRLALAIPPEALERGARFEDEVVRNYVAQIAMWYARKGGVLSVETLTRFMADPRREIRSLHVLRDGRRVADWPMLLWKRVEVHPCARADVAAIASLTLDDRPARRENAFKALDKAIRAPGRGRVLTLALSDPDEGIRKSAPDWLAPREPDGAPDRLDAEAVREVLRVLGRGDAERGAPEAAEVLERLPRARRLELLRPALEHGDPVVRDQAGARLTALTEGEWAWDPGGDPARQSRRLAVWWWERSHPGQDADALLAQLQDDNPTTRYRAAQALAGLPTARVRNALIASTATEALPWVLEAKLAAAAAASGVELGFHDGLEPAGLEACAERFRAWLARTVHEELQGGGR